MKKTTTLTITTNFTEFTKVLTDPRIKLMHNQFLPVDYINMFNFAATHKREKVRKNGTLAPTKIYYLSTSNKELTERGATVEFTTDLHNLYVSYYRFMAQSGKNYVGNYHKNIKNFLSKYFLAKVNDETGNEVLRAIRHSGRSKNRTDKNGNFIEGCIDIVSENNFRMCLFSFICDCIYRNVKVAVNDKI